MRIDYNETIPLQMKGRKLGSLFGIYNFLELFIRHIHNHSILTRSYPGDICLISNVVSKALHALKGYQQRHALILTMP